MLDALNFVGAKPDDLHFVIEHNSVTSIGQGITSYSPIPLNLSVRPNASKLMRAIKACSDKTMTFNLVANGKLSVRSGKFRALVDCLPFDGTERTCSIAPPPQAKLTGDILPILKKLYPFVSDDNTKTWARGILFHGQSAYATNNVVVIEHWLGASMPQSVNVPKATIAELLRINVAPVGISMSDTTITFHYDGHRHITSQVYTSEWPDVSQVFKNVPGHPLPPDFWASVHQLMSVRDGAHSPLYVTQDALSTSQKDDSGAHVTLESPVAMTDKITCVDMTLLLKLEDVATDFSFDGFPGPVSFYGENLRGMLACLRMVE